MEDAIRARRNEEGEVEQVVERLVAASLRRSQHLLDVDNGDVSEPMSPNGIAENMVSQFRQRFGEEIEDGDGCVDTEPLPSTREQERALSLAMRVIGAQKSQILRRLATYVN